MQSGAMTPYGRALRAFVEGQISAAITLRRDDGVEVPLPVGHFFRAPSHFSAIEVRALEACRGTTLDVGAGAGIHSLALQSRGVAITAIDIDAEAVNVMRRRGVCAVHRADVFEYRGGPFDTLLMLGHGIGMTETIAGLERFLHHARTLVADDGQVLLESLDVTRTADPTHLAYHDANRRAGRYIGEIRIQMEFEGVRGPFCGWLQVDALTLADHARSAGWSTEVLIQQETGDYLARLVRRGAEKSPR